MRWLPLLSLVACGSSGPDLTGTWTGSCELQGSVPEIYDLTYELTDDQGVLSGTAEVFPDWMMDSLSGTLSGDHDEGDITLQAFMGDDAVNFTLTLEGTVKPTHIEGDCATEAAAGTGSLDRKGSGT